jgi:hypothetical protein
MVLLDDADQSPFSVSPYTLPPSFEILVNSSI